jgi:uncharacterized membrane protein YhiD involved in acid resistance
VPVENISDNTNYLSNLSVYNFVLAILISYLLSTLLGFVFKRYGNTLSNHDSLANVFPILSITTTIIISVVKSSLALSLGLVGALSIVRFRSPIKEPEELAYIFLSIAIGLTLGADQFLAAIIGSILSFIAIIANNRLVRFRRIQKTNTLRLLVEGIKIEDFDEFISLIKTKCKKVEFVNLMSTNAPSESGISLALTIKTDSIESIKDLTQQVADRFKNSSLNIIETQRF